MHYIRHSNLKNESLPMKRLFVIVLMLLLVACEADESTTAQNATTEPTPTAPPTATATPEPPTLEFLRVELLNTYPHDGNAFTQGLLLHDGFFYESTGLYGESDLRRVHVESGEVTQILRLPDQFFGEGLALVDDRLIQITWRENVALVYDRETFEVIGSFSYEGDGWGLCYDGEVLYMTDGTSALYIRDAETFELLDTRFVTTVDGDPVTRLNELECVGEHIYANVWQTNTIVRIEKATGVVTGIIDTVGLLSPEEMQELGNRGVLNGIAYNPDSDVFYITGKLWTQLFEVRFVPLDS